MKALVTPAVLCAALAAVAFTARADEPEKSPGERFALLVGVKKYDDSSTLGPVRFAENDVAELAKVLEESGYRKQNILQMTRERGAEDGRAMPESARIRKELDRLLKGRRKNDVVLIAFSGHGVQFQGSRENYFCPMDAKLADKKTLIPLQEVYAALEKCDAGLKVLLVDAGRNDPQSTNVRPRDEVELEAVARPRKDVRSGGVAAFYSCSAGQLAFEDEELQHGVFFHYVIQGLRGRAAPAGTDDVFLNDLEFYVGRSVQTFVRHKFSQVQQPQFHSKLTGKEPPLVSRPKVSEPTPGSKR